MNVVELLILEQGKNELFFKLFITLHQQSLKI